MTKNIFANEADKHFEFSNVDDILVPFVNDCKTCGQNHGSIVVSLEDLEDGGVLLQLLMSLKTIQKQKVLTLFSGLQKSSTRVSRFVL